MIGPWACVSYEAVSLLPILLVQILYIFRCTCLSYTLAEEICDTTCIQETQPRLHTGIASDGSIYIVIEDPAGNLGSNTSSANSSTSSTATTTTIVSLTHTTYYQSESVCDRLLY